MKHTSYYADKLNETLFFHARDKKNRIYKILELRPGTTLLESLSDQSRVVIPNNNWDQIGFERI